MSNAAASSGFKRVVCATAKRAKRKGRVCVSLETDSELIRIWLPRDRATSLAAEIWKARFKLPHCVQVNEPPKWKKKPSKVFILFKTTVPCALGSNPSYAAEVIRSIKDPLQRKQHEHLLPAIDETKARWDKRAERHNATLHAEMERMLGTSDPFGLRDDGRRDR